jgi:RNA polymerase sigma-70 factor (ECF subfamily)
MQSKALPAPDWTLVTSMAQGDPAALRELVRRHGQTLYALAYGILVDTADAEEVVAETFQYAWRTAARFAATASGSVFRWLTGIARSRARGLVLAREWTGRLSHVREPARLS